MNQFNISPSDIASLARTKNEAAKLLEMLQELNGFIFNAKENPVKKIDETLPLEKKQTIAYLCKKNNLDIQNSQDLQKLLSEVIEKVVKTETLTLHIAFEPNEETVNLVVRWILIHLKIFMFVDFKVDERLIAGAVFDYRGTYKDFSIKKKLEENWQPQPTIQ